MSSLRPENRAVAALSRGKGARDVVDELDYRERLTAGQRMLARRETSDALRLFHEIQVEATESSPEIADRARKEIDAIEGRGPLGNRVEFLQRNLFSEAAAPAALIGMAGAQAIYGVARASFLFRLASSPTSHFLTRGFGARALASSGAFILEAPSFVAFQRSARSLLEKNPIAATWSHDIAASFLTLGGLKLAGWAGQTLLPQNQAANQATMLTGILAGQRLEEFAGLRAPSDGASALLDSFATLFQFNLAGRILHGATGEGWKRFQQELQIRGEGSGDRNGKEWDLVAERLAWAQAKKLESRKFSPLLMMSKAEDLIASAPPSV